MQIQSLLEQFPTIRTVHLFDLSPAAIEAMAQRWAARYPAVRFLPAPSAEAAVRPADVVVTATVTDTPYLPFSWLKKGAFVSNVSIMDVHKDVYEKADKVIVDAPGVTLPLSDLRRKPAAPGQDATIVVEAKR